MRKPDFKNLLRVLDRKKPDRPTLFEFFLNKQLYEKLAGENIVSTNRDWQWNTVCPVLINAFKNAGYDYVTVQGSTFSFPVPETEHKKTISLNAGNAIHDRDSYKAYQWLDPKDFDYSLVKNAGQILPHGMKLVVCGPGGVLENAISLVGYERLCMMLFDNQVLAGDIFASIGERLVEYYRICAAFDSVGALISNDDWGFKTQTMLSPEDMRKYVIPWHKKIVDTIHSAGKPAILHSCGKLDEVMDDIINIGYDAKHSYEDIIEPVESFYKRMSDKIAVVGGIDLNFIINSPLEQIKTRSLEMLKLSENKGAYALGTGNSVPDYVPDENYFAMINVIRETV
ncbi:MAG: methylcobalamin:coenzyme M methyltransferase [Planctomycetes bacterium ADurb.Bin401]|nr:MAG: methylcobalamin:coenzyme M methyltransferase [Planctomycetes bacterium ADurb.Bin401]